jgi:hypothetical protein
MLFSPFPRCCRAVELFLSGYEAFVYALASTNNTHMVDDEAHDVEAPFYFEVRASPSTRYRPRYRPRYVVL